MTWRVDEVGKAQLALQRFDFRREAVLAALRLPANARIQFGGREWLQDFDDEACLIVTVPR